jgi:hypothetical protein
LRQLSADQINQQRLPQSPSMPIFSNENERPNYHRSRESISSDVRGKVDFLNSLSNPSSPTKGSRPFALPQTPTNAAFQRAVLGFEESQASLASAQAEIERLKEQLKSGKHREKLVSERIESLIDQLATERESRTNDKKAYVAEVKKCRKQAYQAEMGQLEIQESLKEVKQELRRAQAEVAAERAKKEAARQEAFERAYAVSGLSEEAETLKTTLKAVEKERDAAVQELRRTPAPELAFSTVEERAVQTSPLQQHVPPKQAVEDPEIVDDTTVQQSRGTATPAAPSEPGKAISRAAEPFYSEFVDRDQYLRDLYDEPFTYEDHIRALYEEVQATKDEVIRQREQVELMRLQCQTGSCECKQAEKRGERYIYDQAFEHFCQERARKKRRLDDQEPRSRSLPSVPAVQDDEQSTIIATVDEAASIPLPLPVEHEFGSKSKDPSPEPTALLEELTQVMVEPGRDGRGRAPFVFSTSVSSRFEDRAGAPELIHTQSANEVPDLDMFDMAMAKDHPPRPSTAMGILSVPSPDKSPIRLVPDSPDVRSLPPTSVIRDDERLAYTSQTLRVALKDSSPRGHRRAQSRPNIRSKSQTRSPLHKSETHHFEKATSASPAASTVFPITPMAKHHRFEAQQTVTTTTTVPLRDFDDSAYSDSTSDLHGHPHTSSQGHCPTEPAPMLSGITGTPVSRDAALAQIRARRDRARSLNMKKMEAGSKTPGSARRGIMLKEGVIGGMSSRDTRDVSVTSVQTAPGRF